MIGVHQCSICVQLLLNGRKPLKDQEVRVAASCLRARFCYCQLPCSCIRQGYETYSGGT